MKVLWLSLFSLVGTAIWGGEPVDAEAALERLKGLEGSWTGTAGEPGSEKSFAAELVFRVSANGTVVMETMAPGTSDEMINMYHLDGDDLVVTHYCAGGNQPHMRLDRAASTADSLTFAFAGGTNLDPAVDEHIHDVQVSFAADGKLESSWNGWSDGKPAAVMQFHLARAMAP